MVHTKGFAYNSYIKPTIIDVRRRQFWRLQAHSTMNRNAVFMPVHVIGSRFTRQIKFEM